MYIKGEMYFYLYLFSGQPITRFNVTLTLALKRNASRIFLFKPLYLYILRFQWIVYTDISVSINQPGKKEYEEEE